MDYGKIIRESFALSWRYKTLWILGIFAGIGGGFNTSFDKNDIEGLSRGPLAGVFGGAGNNPAEIWHTLAPYAVGLTIFGLLFLAMHCIAVPGLIDAVNRITRGGMYKLSESFSTGVDFFWRTLGMLILFGVGIIVSICALVAIVMVAWLAAMPLGVISLLLAIPVVFGVVVISVSVYSLAQRAMVTRNVSIGDALAEGYTLFRTHLGKCVIFLIIFVLLSIALGMAVMMITVVIFAPIGLLAYSFGLAAWQAFLFALIVSLPVTIPVGGYLGTFNSAMYTIFYFALVEPEGPVYAAPRTTPEPEPLA